MKTILDVLFGSIMNTKYYYIIKSSYCRRLSEGQSNICSHLTPKTWRLPNLILLIVGALFTILTYSGSASADSEILKMKIGIIIPQSGEAANYGVTIRQGMELAYKSLQAEMREQIELKYDDDGLDPKRTISAFNALLAWGANAVVNFSSATAHAIAPLAEKSKIPLIAIASDPAVVKTRKYSFLHWVSSEAEARMAAEELARRNLSTIAIVSTEHAGTLAIVESLTKIIGNAKTVLSESYAYDVRDFRSTINRIKARKPSAVALVLLPGQCSIFAKQLKQSGYKGETFGFEMMSDTSEVKAAAGALDGIWYVDGYAGTPEFLAAYKQNFGADAGLYGAANGYDIINLLVSAWSKGLQTGSQIAEHLATLKDYRGACGEYSATGDNRFTLKAEIKKTAT